MAAYWWVFVGGGLGSMCRFACAQWLNRSDSYPWGTLLANGLSCIVLGALVALVAKQHLSAELRLLLVTGFCGGFSTFSTFSLETLELFRNGAYMGASAYVLGSLILGLFAIWVGMKLI